MRRSIKRIKLILPALTEATGPFWHRFKYSLFPSLGLQRSLHISILIAGWKKFEPAWDLVIRTRRLSQLRPMVEAVLTPVVDPRKSGNGSHLFQSPTQTVAIHIVESSY